MSGYYTEFCVGRTPFLNKKSSLWTTASSRVPVSHEYHYVSCTTTKITAVTTTRYSSCTAVVLLYLIVLSVYAAGGCCIHIHTVAGIMFYCRLSTAT